MKIDTPIVMRAILRSPLVRALEIWVFGVLPVFTAVETTLAATHIHKLAFDFDHAYYPAARLVLHGASPYGPTTHAALGTQTAFVYPPIGAYLTTPFTVLPHLPADLVVTALATLAVPALLATLGVRDWRCMGAALLWWPTVSAIRLGTVSLALALGVALAWKLRERPVPAGVVVGLVVAVKLLLWPLVIWLAITRRTKTALIAAGSSVAFILVPWIPIRGAGLLSYPHRLMLLSSLEAKRGFSPAALFADLGSSWTTAQVLGYGLGCLLLVWAFKRRSCDATALALTLGASLLLSPILWPNYLVLLLVPLALTRPRLDVWWLLPVAMFTQRAFDPAEWEIVMFLGIFAALVLAMARAGGREGAERRSPVRLLRTHAVPTRVTTASALGASQD